jgi:dUTPase
MVPTFFLKELMPTQIVLSPELKETLRLNNVTEYVPAYESVGLDLYYPGTPFPKPGLVPTGLRVNIRKGYAGLLLDRSSITKTRFIRRAGVIDPGYTGEIYVNLIDSDTGLPLESLDPHQKLPVQLVVVACDSEFEETSSLDNVSSLRGDKGFGSTNRS